MTQPTDADSSFGNTERGTILRRTLRLVLVTFSVTTELTINVVRKLIVALTRINTP